MAILMTFEKLKFNCFAFINLFKPLRNGRFFYAHKSTAMNTTNPNCFTYATDELLIELLGGVRVDTFDRMRVTIKVSVTNRKHPQHTSETAGLAVRHNLDLYNDTQLEKFIRRVAEKLEVGTIAITKAIADIISQLEV
jgi:hypothetical protein